METATGTPGNRRRKLRRFLLAALLLSAAGWVAWSVTRMPGDSFEGPRPTATVQ